MRRAPANRRRPEPDLVFSCRDASVEFAHRDGPRRILDRISLELRRGEFLTVVGPSGTGKTTLLRLLGGLTPSTQGAVQVNGRPIDGPPAGVVIVFQDYSHALLQWRTVGRNVAFGLEGKLPRAEIDGAGATTRCASCGSRRTRTTTPGSSPAACSSASRSRARWRCARPCC